MRVKYSGSVRLFFDFGSLGLGCAMSGCTTALLARMEIVWDEIRDGQTQIYMNGMALSLEEMSSMHMI